MSYGKTIRIYLADGVASGIRHAEVVNWTGQAVVCPRGRIGELNTWPESKRQGVYVLFGEDELGGKPLAYIGEAENVQTRLQGHVHHKAFWDQVVFFTSKDDNLTKAHVKYLESRMVRMATAAARVALENGNAPQQPALPRPDQDAMEEFLETVGLLLQALGFPLLKAVPQKARPQRPSTEAGTGPLADTRLFFRVDKLQVSAEGASTDDGFVVYADSRGAATVKDSLSSGWQSLREQLVADGSLKVDGDVITFTKDVLFKSPSAAAAVVCGGSRNGRRYWIAEDGRTLQQLEEELAGAETDVFTEHSE